jgi:hypothetical protein
MGVFLVVQVDDQIVGMLHLCAAFLYDFRRETKSVGGGDLHEMSLIWSVFKSNEVCFGSLTL